MTDSNQPDIELLQQKLNRDTGRIQWSTLSSYEQQDAIILVASQLDLIVVASEFVRDNTDQVNEWVTQSQVCRIDEKVIQQWDTQDPELWAVVVSPWILVQKPT